MPSFFRQPRWLLALVFTSLFAARARAHDPARGLNLRWASDAKAALPLIVANRGLVYADTEGATTHFSLRCAEGFGASVADLPGVFFETPDSLVISIYKGVSLTSDRACTEQPGTGLVGTSFGAAVQDVGAPNRLFVTSRSVQDPSALFVSEDYGRTWTQRYANPASSYYDSLLVAPSDPQRLYATGLHLDTAKPKLYYLSSVSLDSGKNWQDTPFETHLTQFAVHPQNADIVFAYEPALSVEPLFRVLRSDDKGKTYKSVLEGVPQPVAFTVSANDASEWLGLAGPSGAGGLYRSLDKGLHFERVHADTIQQATCLTQRQGRLWLCANMAPNTSGVWYSDDDGASFQKFMIFADVTDPVLCDGEAQALCARAWLDFDTELHPRDYDAGVVADAGAIDAGAEPSAEAGDAPSEDASAVDSSTPETEARPKKPGGKCQLGAVRAPTLGCQGLLLLLAGTLGARRRKRRAASIT